MKNLLYALLVLLFGNTLAAQNIRLVKNINTYGHGDPYILTAFNDGTILFIADDNTNGKELWRSDGTPAGTYMVKDIYPGAHGGKARVPHVYANGLVYFSGNGGLWVTDGTSSGTRIVSNNMTLYSAPSYTWYNSMLYFNVRNKSTGKQELWVSDGTDAGTQRAKNILPNYDGGAFDSPVIVSGKLYFLATTSTHGRELWVTDGTNQGTKLVKDLNPGQNDGVIGTLITYDNKIYFWGRENNNMKAGLYASDGNNIDLIKIIYQDSIWKNLSIHFPLDNSIVYDGKLYFAAADENANREVWVTDGTAQGTYMLKDIWPGTIGSSDPYFLAAVFC